jgi:hypothetical protein
MVIGGNELGTDKGKKLIISKSLYGLRSSGATFHEPLPTSYELWDTFRHGPIRT